MKIYTGVGSRKTPPEILETMRELAKRLASSGWLLRSGGALGADSAFQSGAGSQSQIYRPEQVGNAALKMAAPLHPAWDRLSEYVKKLMGRNCYQILGEYLIEPSKFVVCWTPDGCTSHSERTIRTGGTGLAISLASINNIPVFNLARPEHRERIRRFIA